MREKVLWPPGREVSDLSELPSGPEQVQRTAMFLFSTGLLGQFKRYAEPKSVAARYLPDSDDIKVAFSVS